MRPVLMFSAAAALIAAAYVFFAFGGLTGASHYTVRDSLPADQEALVPHGRGEQGLVGTERSEGGMHAGSATPDAVRARKRLGAAPYAATERAMLTKGSINEVAIEALNSKEFDHLVTQFEVEQAGMTGEITAAYRAELQRLLGSIDEPNQIDRLVCGTDLCIASIRSRSRDWFPAWYESMQESSSLPMNALTGNSIDLGGSGIEYRLLFSISNEVKSFRGSAPRS